MSDSRTSALDGHKETAVLSILSALLSILWAKHFKCLQRLAPKYNVYINPFDTRTYMIFCQPIREIFVFRFHWSKKQMERALLSDIDFISGERCMRQINLSIHVFRN